MANQPVGPSASNPAGTALTAAAPAIEVRNLRKRLGGRWVLKGIDLVVPRGKVLALIGPSAGGKTTLLKCINMILPIDEGQVLCNGSPVITATSQPLAYPAWRRLAHRVLWGGLPPQLKVDRRVHVPGPLHRQRVGMVFQEYNLWPARTVMANLIEGPVYVLRRTRAQASDQARELLDRFSLSGTADRLPTQLSGGQRQRVALIRALMMEPEVLLADEITSALDLEWVGEVLQMLRTLASSGLSMLVVTHAIQFARQVADYVVMLDEGMIVESGPAAQVLENPRHDRTRAFLRHLLDAR